MPSGKKPKVGGVFGRIVLFANLVVIMAYGAVTPQEMSKVTAICVTIGIGGLAMAVQTYVTVAVFTCLPYNIWAVIGLDGLCAAGWAAAIAVLSYWDRNVVYMPGNGDPQAWFKCANAKYWDTVLTSDGFGQWINIVWCQVKVNGQDRLVGNGAARQQLHVLIGLSTVSLFFTGLLLLWMVKRGSHLGLIKPRH
ncbi:hypothetical protein JX265_007120 [Neoarthrinium moseri]|uniref:MARVEL domain-containing protein n=1 Tax=Neoarthrinium moseri TaxID=1658444 RepID=A0A9P9WKK9_9PEZI|nr:hypothetical protein JX265_007120 [Neoarthrinium moseri]